MVQKRAGSFRSPNRRISSRVAPLMADLVQRICGGREDITAVRDLKERGFGSAFAQCEFDAGSFPEHLSASDFRVAYLSSELFSKFDPGLKAQDELRRNAAIVRFKEAEERCRQANVRLSTMESRPLFKGVTTSSVIFTAARKISYLLGDPDLDEIAEGFGFGPGATTRLSRRRSDPYYKFSGNPETTVSNAPFALAALRQVPRWFWGFDSEPKALVIREENRIVTVPKNAKIDRLIAIEPDMNIYVQKGVGAVIRKRLKRVGIDLNDQTRNQDLAFAGSLDGSLATIDLSMASDTVSYEIVRALLPPQWFCILEQMRTTRGILPSGEQVSYQKFSSMGNGFTFELESLIFWALCQAVIDLMQLEDRRLGVYGDDLIVPTDAVVHLLDVLEFCGFVPNPKKTFTSGPFRESCGKHYFRGVDVTPFYVRRPVTTLEELFLFHNNVLRWLYDPETGYVESSEEVAGLLKELRNCAPDGWRKPRVPLFGYGDGAFAGPFDVCTPPTFRKKDGWVCFQASVLLEKSCYDEVEGHEALLVALRNLEGRGSHASRVTDQISQGASARFARNGQMKAMITKIMVPRWDEVGWLAY